VWQRAASASRAQVISDIRPAFITVLDASDVPQDDWTRENFLSMKYSGPLYFDWDCNEIADVLPEFKMTLARFIEMGLDLDTIAIYATGGRGFHLEIPELCFMAKVPAGGTVQLPYIYKEMARRHVSDNLDMRVYSGRRGRMWRTPGVKRSNGHYKVQITPHEALHMTTDLYQEVTSAARAAIVLKPPTMCTALNGDFAEARKKVENLVRSQKKSRQEVNVLKAFNGDYPPAVRAIMAGVGYDPDKGFNQIAMQLCITANALGKGHDEFMADCLPLCKVHAGDGQRYNSPKKRIAAMSEMYWYTHENDLYDYSVGAIRNICASHVEASSVSGQADEDEPYSVVIDDDEEQLPDDERPPEKRNTAKYQGLRMSRDGVFKKTQEGDLVHISDLVFGKPSVLVDLEDGRLLGLSADMYSGRNPFGRKSMGLDIFNSRAALDKFAAGFRTHFLGTDMNASVMRTLLSDTAERANAMEYAVHREGLDLVQNPNEKGVKKLEPIWVGAEDEIFMSPTFHDRSITYRHKPRYTSRTLLQSDVHRAPLLDHTPETEAWFRNLFKINHPQVVATMLGWFVSTFHRQFYDAVERQFPLLHAYGTAGCGKTQTSLLFSGLYYTVNKPMVLNCGKTTTEFTIKGALYSSASIPVLLDEYKPAELESHRYHFLLQVLRGAYDNAPGGSGGMTDGSASASFRDITHFTLSAPVVYLGESQEMQTALMQRSLGVGFSPTHKHEAPWEVVNASREFMPRFGHHIMLRSLDETVESRRAALAKFKALAADPALHSRTVLNLAVVLAGLEFAKEAAAGIFGGMFDAEFDALQAAVLDSRASDQPPAQSEASKVLNDMGLISRSEASDSEFALREGFEYVVREGGIELLMRESFVKYHSWCKRKGFTPLYRSAEVFVSALLRMPATDDSVCADSPLKKTAGQKVFRFNLERLRAEGVDDFKSKVLGN
jgi:hypothetical protein